MRGKSKGKPSARKPAGGGKSPPKSKSPPKPSAEELKRIEEEKKRLEAERKAKEEAERKAKEEEERIRKLQAKIRYKVIFIFRRNEYEIKNLKYPTTFDQVRKMIAKQLSLDVDELIVNYKDKEFKDGTKKVYELFKEGKDNYFTIKKKLKSDNYTEIPALTSNSSDATVFINDINSVKDLNEKIDEFFSQLVLERNCIIEPLSLRDYSVSFVTVDLAFDFKRYLLYLKRSDPKYKDIEIRMKPSKSNNTNKNILNRSLETKGKQKNKLISPNPYFLNTGPYIDMEEIKKKEEKESKKKWMTKDGFNNYFGKPEEDYYY